MGAEKVNNTNHPSLCQNITTNLVGPFRYCQTTKIVYGHLKHKPGVSIELLEIRGHTYLVNKLRMSDKLAHAAMNLLGREIVRLLTSAIEHNLENYVFERGGIKPMFKFAVSSLWITSPEGVCLIELAHPPSIAQPFRSPVEPVTAMLVGIGHELTWYLNGRVR